MIRVVIQNVPVEHPLYPVWVFPLSVTERNEVCTNDGVQLKTTNIQTGLLKEVNARKEREPKRLSAGITEVRRDSEAHKAVLVCGAVGCLVVHRKPIRQCHREQVQRSTTRHTSEIHRIHQALRRI